MFANVSNHPSNSWSKKQRDEAMKIGKGEIIDFPPGNVDPYATTEQVYAIARNLERKIYDELSKYKDTTLAVHVATELTLTVALVNILKQYSVRSYVATTIRDVVVTTNVDGSTNKQAIFKFIAWREYP